MLSRRQVLRSSIVAGLGLAVIGVGAAARKIPAGSAVDAVWRRLSAGLNMRRQPATWADSPAPAEVSLHVDLAPARSISPLIYGVAVANPTELESTGARLNRWGGNPNSRYNWVHGNAWNAARDWEFRNYGASADLPTVASDAANLFVHATRSAGASGWITIPALGWVARDGDSAHASSGVPLDGGPPVAPGSDAIKDYDPRANRETISVRSTARKPGVFVVAPDPRGEVVYQDEWVHHLVSRFGTAAEGGAGFYAIDNEPDLWSTTHTDVHPVQPDYAEMLSAFIEYASAIKDVDPSARITGPGLSGWTSMFYSARDRGADNYRTHADRLAHGDEPFLAWWLRHLREYDEQHARRLLDAIDVHYYPQATGAFGPLGDEATQRRRLRSTRSLWDATYVDESWIGEPVNLLPRLRSWRDQLYPSTPIAIGEWNWGADDTLNGALAIANVLGILGREGVDMACYWTCPAPGSPGAHAFSMFTRYGFGDLALLATSTAPEDVAVYASQDSASGNLTIVALNHRPDAAIRTRVQVLGKSARWYLYSAADLRAIREVGTVESGPSGLTLTLPPESLSLLRLS